MTGAPYVMLIAFLGFALLGLTLRADAQRRTSATTTSFDDVVFAIAFSPDARTLAIARGASEPLHRFGRIELWDTETGKLRHLIKGFDGPVRSISFSPDGHTLISASTEFRSSKIQQKPGSREGLTFGELKWWDTRTGELKHKLTMPGERSYSFQATQSPDGKQLALTESFREQFMMVNPTLTQGPAGIDMGLPRAFFRSRLTFKKEMKLVDAKTGELIFKLDADQPGDVSFAPYGNLLAVANGKEVKLWNSQTGKEIRKLKNLRGDANAIAFSPNGRNLAVASTRYEREDAEHFIKIIAISEVKIFDVGTGKIILTLKDVGAVNTLAFSPDGRILVVGGVLPENKGEAAGMKLFNLQTGKVNNLPTGANYKEAVGSLELSHNGGLLAFRAGPATVKLIETENGTMRQTWDADSVGDAVERSKSRFLLSVTRVLVVTFSADGKTVSGESDHGVIKSWDHRTGEVKRHVNIEQDDPSLVAASSDGKSFAEISEGKLLVWDASSDTKRIVPLAGPNTVTALALSPDGRTLVVGRGSEVMLILPSGEVTKTLSGPEGLVSRLAFTNDGRLLAGSEEGGTVYIWNVATGRIEKTLTTVAEVTALVFAPNGETLATAAQDNTIKLWNWRIGLSQGRLQKHEATINALAFSPDGRFLASGGDDRMTVLWEVTTGESKRTFKGHDQTVASLAFSPDGRLLASGSGNASVVLWEVETGKLSRVLK